MGSRSRNEEALPGVPAGAIRFSFVASAGPGGQNVNRRATRAELRLDVRELRIPEPVRERLVRLAGRRVDAEGCVRLTSDRFRSQERNRSECIERLRGLLERALRPPRPRRPTAPSPSSVERRLRRKSRRAHAKQRRRAVEPE